MAADEENGKDEVTVEVFKGEEFDEGATRALDKITEHRQLKICISKEVIAQLAKEIMEGKVQEPKRDIYVRFEYNCDKEDEEIMVPSGQIIAY